MKPTHAKPSLYAYYFLIMKEVAKDCGYNLLVHGSLNRDLDLVAIPWVDNPKPEMDLVNELSRCIGGKVMYKNIIGAKNKFVSYLPGGRTNYVIDLYRGGYKKNAEGEIIDPLDFTPDPEYYIDISVTPLGFKNSTDTSTE